MAHIGAEMVVFNKIEKGWIAFPQKLWKHKSCPTLEI